MAQQHYLCFLIRDQAEDLMFEVRKDESDRLAGILGDRGSALQAIRFFWFRSLDGTSIAINLADVQGVRYLWDPVILAPDAIRSDDMVRIMLRGRDKPLEEYTESPDQLYAFFTSLESDLDGGAFLKFDDQDGEPLQLNPHEVVWISAPSHLLDEGARMIADEAGFQGGDT